MADLVAKDTLLIALLMRSGFGAPFVYSHDGLIGPFDPLVGVHDDGNVDCMVGSWYVNNVGCCFCRIVFGYFLRDFLSLCSCWILFFLLFLGFLVFIGFV